MQTLASLRLNSSQITAWRAAAEGKALKQIADEMDVNIMTASNWLTKTRQVTGSRNVADLTRAAIRFGLITA